MLAAHTSPSFLRNAFEASSTPRSLRHALRHSRSCTTRRCSPLLRAVDADSHIARATTPTRPAFSVSKPRAALTPMCSAVGIPPTSLSRVVHPIKIFPARRRNARPPRLLVPDAMSSGGGTGGVSLAVSPEVFLPPRTASWPRSPAPSTPDADSFSYAVYVPTRCRRHRSQLASRPPRNEHHHLPAKDPNSISSQRAPSTFPHSLLVVVLVEATKDGRAVRRTPPVPSSAGAAVLMRMRIHILRGALGLVARRGKLVEGWVGARRPGRDGVLQEEKSNERGRLNLRSWFLAYTYIRTLRPPPPQAFAIQTERHTWPYAPLARPTWGGQATVISLASILNDHAPRRPLLLPTIRTPGHGSFENSPVLDICGAGGVSTSLPLIMLESLVGRGFAGLSLDRADAVSFGRLLPCRGSPSNGRSAEGLFLRIKTEPTWSNEASCQIIDQNATEDRIAGVLLKKKRGPTSADRSYPCEILGQFSLEFSFRKLLVLAD
ncbi:hypothetical protein B0H16DRAFT_1855502 [Mycena metata]|uniref:Uncharacterized protein n=1 Tax=Mycena metata TaxID=1033252 RepID=A0AAD7DH96_9AGAR|nr:hypothetical protein B0H16DRAFT_1855502 [Mycena metata]